jgi:hypothetical protein
MVFLRPVRRDLVGAPGTTRLADGAGIVAAAGQDEGHLVSAKTCSVAGEYWISSISRFWETTLQG